MQHVTTNMEMESLKPLLQGAASNGRPASSVHSVGALSATKSDNKNVTKCDKSRQTVLNIHVPPAHSSDNSGWLFSGGGVPHWLSAWLPDCVRGWLNRHRDLIKLFTLFALLLYKMSTYTLDFVIDMSLIVAYALDKHWWFFGLTLTFVFCPAAIISYLNWKYYDEKWQVKRKINETDDELGLKAKIIVDPQWKFHLRRGFCLLLFSPIVR